jgi:ribosomal protein S18 acetylase RimI-like enzyme
VGGNDGRRRLRGTGGAVPGGAAGQQAAGAPARGVRQQLVGAGRALADGRDCSYLCDIAVHPDTQGSGLGREIVQRLVDRSRGHKKIILYAVPGKEPFYGKFGFKRMTTAMAIFEDEAGARARGMIVDE